jgi:protein-tyrosine-phosphatase
MAAAIAQSLSNEVSAASAGLFAYDGEPASAHAAAAMAKRKLSLEGHSAKQVSRDEADGAYIVLAMTKQHKDALLELFPDHSEKIFALGEYVGASFDIADPYGKDLAAYEKCANEMEALIRRAIEKITFSIDV